MENEDSPEAMVQRLLKEYRHERSNKYYMNWPLKDVPVEVIWNIFSKSNVRLDVP